jgi:hypothetical protein
MPQRQDNGEWVGLDLRILDCPPVVFQLQIAKWGVDWGFLPLACLLCERLWVNCLHCQHYRVVCLPATSSQPCPLPLPATTSSWAAALQRYEALCSLPHAALSCPALCMAA